MKCKLVKIGRLSGNKASVYSVIMEGNSVTLFDQFVLENKTTFKSEIKDIALRLQTIGQKTGARETFFKLNEGKPGDGVCALYDHPNSNLRLYCIRYGNDIIILGSGGHKPKSGRAFQEVEKLEKENYLLRKLSELITERLKDDELRFSDDDLSLEGNMIFDEDE